MRPIPMPKGPRGERRPADVIGAAIMVAKIATGEIEDAKAPTKSVAAAQIYSRRLRRCRQDANVRQPWQQKNFRFVCGTSEPHDADVRAAFHTFNECVLKEGRQPLRRARALFLPLQFLSHPQEPSH